MFEIAKRSVVYRTPWFTLEEKIVKVKDQDESQRFYSINEGDHVVVVAEDGNNNILLIRQYRPAVEDFLIELPGGHVENGDPEGSARDELLEETGYEATSLEFLGKVVMDSGRNQGYLYCYYAGGSRRVRTAERGIELKLVPVKDLIGMILDGEFKQALYMSALLLAMLRGLIACR